jgi:two-component system phosphate regulon sensor histidine kinase PhoR
VAVVALVALANALAALLLSSSFNDGLAIATIGALCAAALVAALRNLWLRPQRQFEDALAEARFQLTETTARGQHERAELLSIFDHMADGLLVLAGDERVLLSNPASARLLGRSTSTGRPLPEVARDPDLVQIARAAVDATPVTQVVETRPETGGPRRWLQVVATRLPPGQRRLVLLQDVTELRNAEAARRDFVANVSHELRTPVASLKALVETLESGARDDPVARVDFLRRMHVEVDGLAHLVTELLELARANAARLELELVSCDVDTLLRDACERIQAYAQRVGIRLGVDSRHVPGARVLADERRIGQVLANLLANAIKFTPPGGSIDVGAHHATDGHSVEMWVADTGVGIEPDQLVRIFERFYKVDAARTGRGTGLGLAIAKHLIQGHGGHIWARSAGPGHGATFTFSLPIADSTSTPPNGVLARPARTSSARRVKPRRRDPPTHQGNTISSSP